MAEKTQPLIFPLLEEQTTVKPIWRRQFEQRKEEEEKAYLEAMKLPYYKANKKPTKELWLKQQEQINYTGTILPALTGFVNSVNLYFRGMANNPAKPLYVYPIAALTGLTGLGFLSAPFTTAVSFAGGYAGDKAVNYASKKLTGNDWATNVSNLTELDKTPASFTNPGMYIGAGAGVGILNKALARARAAAYDNITPLGYTDVHLGKGINVGKKQEFLDAAKDFFSFKRLRPDVDNPKWILRIESSELYDPTETMLLNNSNGEIMNGIRIGDILDFRNLAWAKAMKLTPSKNHTLYIDNGDGTVRYNMDVVNSVLKQYKVNPKTGFATNLTTGVRGWNGIYKNKNSYWDTLTTNGGFVGTKNIGGKTYIIDKWDLLPFHDGHRTLSKFVTKYIPGSRNFEAVNALKGNPFTLKHPVQ